MPHVDFPQTHCRGSIARRDITPPPGIYHRMWGAATHDRSTGIHRPLTATVLALAPAEAIDDDTRADLQLLVGIDHCLFWTPEIDALRTAVAQTTNIPLDRIHVTFSHTHAAGLMDPPMPRIWPAVS